MFEGIHGTVARIPSMGTPTCGTSRNVHVCTAADGAHMSLLKQTTFLWKTLCAGTGISAPTYYRQGKEQG